MYLLLLNTHTIMEIVANIKPGPKRQTEEGRDDRRQRVDPPSQPKHPTLKPHKHTKGK